MRKSAFIIFLSIILAVIFTIQPAAKTASETAENYKEYISVVKIGVGKTEAEAASSLDGYTILKDNGKNVDLNQDAGGGIGSKGERVVYLGYKTTTDRSEAITDLAVMNMKGGYSVKDYELLMEQYMTEQIIPFVDGFLAAIKEYRENCKSEFAENKARAEYLRSELNKLTDDDCGNAGLGDLLLNETKYEMGDAAYEALSDDEKAKHADILTIISQANGKATLIIENLITRAADTNEDSWIDRFVATSYDDLLALYPDMLPTDAAAELAKKYDDDARQLLSMWGVLAEQLAEYDKKAARLEELLARDLTEYNKTVEEYDPENATEEQTDAFTTASAEITVVTDLIASLSADIAVRDYLASIEYGEGTLADFFSDKYETALNDITVLYPLAASLTAGQRAGLGFVSLVDLIMIAATDAEGYKEASSEDAVPVSVYEGVDREIYKKGGVALTSEALRAHAAEEFAADGFGPSILSYVLYGVTAASVVAFGVTAAIRISLSAAVSSAQKQLKFQKRWLDTLNKMSWNPEKLKSDAKLKVEKLEKTLNPENKDGIVAKCQARSALCNKLLIGFGVAMVVLSAASLYLTYRDLVDYYNVEYSPIPKYIVDEKDITAYNEKGEKTVIKNLSAYYKAVETNRAEGDEWYDILGASSDLNGTVGRQWLALYAAKNENESPILASSLKVVTGSDKVPADYTTGIHMFGSESAYNLNNTQLVWNNEAKSVYVYFNVDTSASGSLTTGSSFTADYIILAAVAGLIVGAAAAVCVTLALKNKKKVAA